MHGWRQCAETAKTTRRTVAGWLALSVMLAGCTTQERTFGTAAELAPVRPLPYMQIAPERIESAEIPEPEQSLPVPAEKPPGKALLAKRADLDPERLIGLSLVEAEALLGEPALQDEKPPAKVWTYNAETCVLSIFFYADISTKDFRALTYEIRNEKEVEQEKAAQSGDQGSSQVGKEESEIADRQCLAELIKEHAA